MRIFLCVLMAAFCAAVRGQQADVALVSMVSAGVTYASAAGPAGKVQAFMKIREGDRIVVSANAQIKLVFLDNSRQERWMGAGEFQAGRDGAIAIAGKPAEVITLPAGVGQHVTRIPALVHNAKLGGIQLRGGVLHRPNSEQPQVAVSEARKNYDFMRQGMPADDITPELYLYAVLSDYSLFGEMKPVVIEMLKRQPDNEDLQALDKWVSSKLPNTTVKP